MIVRCRLCSRNADPPSNRMAHTMTSRVLARAPRLGERREERAPVRGVRAHGWTTGRPSVGVAIPPYRPHHEWPTRHLTQSGPGAPERRRFTGRRIHRSGRATRAGTAACDAHGCRAAGSGVRREPRVGPSSDDIGARALLRPTVVGLSRQSGAQRSSSRRAHPVARHACGPSEHKDRPRSCGGVRTSECWP